MAHESDAYKAAGVDLELGSDVSKMLYEASKRTWPNRAGEFGEPELLTDSFSGRRVISLDRLPQIPGLVMYMGDDGVGTKVEVSERMRDHSDVANDLLAMVCDDAVVCGAEPVLVTTTLDVNKLDDSPETRRAIRQLAGGYVRAATLAGVAVINGEVAELGDRVNGWGNFNYNWSATVSWFAHRSRILDGSKIEAGDFLVGLEEYGFRSNGLSLVRKTLEETFGPNWHEEPHPEYEGRLGESVRTPSQIYSKLVVALNGGYDLDREPLADIHGVAHITGGGIPEKLKRMLEGTRCGADIFDPYTPSEDMDLVQALSGIRDEEAYRVWNMGQGMIIATPEPEKVIHEARNYNIGAKVVGIVTDEPVITIASKGLDKHELEYSVPVGNLYL